MARFAAPALAALAASLALGACGSGGGDEDKIRSVVQHLADSDEAVCGEMTPGFVKRTFRDKASCEKQAKASKQKNSFEIESVKIDGDKATAGIGSKGQKGAISLVKQGGDWKMDSIQANRRRR